MTVHDLAADWSWMEGNVGFRLKGGTVMWEQAEYAGNEYMPRISRLVVDGGDRVIARTRSVHPDKEVYLIPREGDR